MKLESKSRFRQLGSSWRVGLNPDRYTSASILIGCDEKLREWVYISCWLAKNELD